MHRHFAITDPSPHEECRRPGSVDASNKWRLHWFLVAAAIAALLSLLAEPVRLNAQVIRLNQAPFQFGPSAPSQLELTPPRVDLISSTAASRLEQVRALIADANWNDALETLRELAAEESDRVVAIDDRRFVSLPDYCQLLISRLPAAGLSLYRRQTDALAEQWYREGIAKHDESLLRRVVDEAYCSSWGDDALLSLGEFALERADYGAARGAWQQISPDLKAPNGIPIWLALFGIDLEAASPAWLAYPDTDLALADVRARLVLASIRAGELDRAALELEVFRRFHPHDGGRLGGQEGPLTAALERLLTSAQQWPSPLTDSDSATFGGSTTRDTPAAPLGPIVGPAWDEAIAFASAETQDAAAPLQPLSVFPLVVDDTVLFADAATLRAADLATGKPALTENGTLYVAAPSEDAGLGTMRVLRSVEGAGLQTLSAADGVVYARLGATQTAPRQSGFAQSPFLVGLDLTRDGLLTFRVQPDDENWSFDGAPVSDGRRVFVAMRKNDITPHAYVACFDATTGGRLWRTSVAAANSPQRGNNGQAPHNLLTLAGERIYFNTNLGIVAALDAADGRIDWLYRYDRAKGNVPARGPNAPGFLNRDPSACVYHRGLVIAAPADTPVLFALDADTGQRVWTTDRLASVTQLLSVVDGGLIASGKQLWMLDVRTGKLRFVWPESEHAGIRGLGRGVVAGSEVFWPTRKEVYVFDVASGAQSRTPIDLSPIGGSGANLAAANGFLIAAGHERIMAFGPFARRAAPNDDPKIEPIADSYSDPASPHPGPLYAR